MTGEQIIYAYARFLGVLPTPGEIIHAGEHFTVEGRHNCYLQLDSRIFSEPNGKRKNLLVYSSCHGEQIDCYLRKYRQDVLDQCYLHILYSHRMALNRETSNNRFMQSLFANADFLIYNVLSEKFGVFSTNVLLKHMKSDLKLCSFVPPSCACWWVLTEHYGEEPVQMAIDEGLKVEEIVALYKASTLDWKFQYRFQTQIDRLRHRERLRDVPLSAYVMRHYKTHRMFFTYNHPSFHVIAYLTDECLGHLGFKQLGEDHSLSVGQNEAKMGNHYPDHSAMWEFYKFEFPMEFQHERGGADAYYPQVIHDIAARYEARQRKPAFIDENDDY